MKMKSASAVGRCTGATDAVTGMTTASTPSVAAACGRGTVPVDEMLLGVTPGEQALGNGPSTAS